MKLFWYGESPFIETGAGQVAKHLLPVFQEYFDEIHQVSINQWWMEENMPPGYSMTPCGPKNCYNVEEALRQVGECDYDVLFLTADMNRLTDLRPSIEKARAKHIPIIMYAAIDCHIYAVNYWKILELADQAVVFSFWCKRQCEIVLPELAKQLQVIYHGCEPDVFYPFSEEERLETRRTMFGIEDDMFLIINVNRNQVRKDLMRTMAAFRLFHMEQQNSVLYLHSKQKDIGGNLVGQAEYLGINVRAKQPEIIFSPENYHELTGISREDLNRIYNCADVCVSTSTGEGWGLTTTEAMAAGTPFIGPNNTVFPEILGGGKRGFLVESGGPDLWVTFYGISDTPRELCSTTGMVDALKQVYQFRHIAKHRAKLAREWTENHTWSQKQDQWRELFSKMGITSLTKLVTA